MTKIAQAKIAIRAALPKIAKTRYQAHRKYKYAGHEDVTEHVIPAMHAAGMSHTVTTATEIIIEPSFGETPPQLWMLVRASITFRVGDETETVEFPSASKLVDGTTAGVLVSYAIKVGLVKYLGIVTGEENDAESFQRADDGPQKLRLPSVMQRANTKTPSTTAKEDW